MQESFVEMLSVGGKSNSLGRAGEVIDIVLRDRSRLDELYQCLFDDDAWVRMRAADSLEKVCRIHPEWLTPYIDRLSRDFATSDQPSTQWHMAQIYGAVELTTAQREFAVRWLKKLLSSPSVDWIVATNSMITLMQFTRESLFPKPEMIALLDIQQQHKSAAVVKRATKLRDELL